MEATFCASAEACPVITSDYDATCADPNRRSRTSRRAADEIRGLGVGRLALFGSFARSEGRAESDVDLLVEFAPARKSYDAFMRLYDLLEERLGRGVELVTTESLSPFIGSRILAEAEDVVRAA